MSDAGSIGAASTTEPDLQYWLGQFPSPRPDMSGSRSVGERGSSLRSGGGYRGQASSQPALPHIPQGAGEPFIFGALPEYNRAPSRYAESVAESTTGRPHNFPDLASLAPDAPTSYPTSHVRRDFEFSLKKLMSQSVFEELLDDPQGRFRLRQFLLAQGLRQDLDALEFTTDVRCYEELLRHVRAIAVGLHNQYIQPGGPRELAACNIETRAKTLNGLRAVFESRATFEAVSKAVQNDLYRNAWPTFIRTKIAEHAKVRLSTMQSSVDRGDIGEVFCLTNPRLPDAPIVLCSDAFCKLTGYSREQVISRNCRFLQGPSTAPESVQKIRDALNAGTPFTELLLNYRKDGTPFWNLLNCQPLKSRSGAIEYVVGGQIEVTGAISSKSSLGYLIGGGDSSQLGAVEDAYADELGAGGQSHELSDEVATAAARELGIESGALATMSVVTRSATPYNGPGSGRRAAGQREPSSSGSETVVSSVPSPRQGGLAKMRSKLFGGKRSSPYDAFSQRIGGAEQQFGEVLEVEEQMDRFQNVYSRLLLMRRAGRKILFASPQMLALLGHPTHGPSVNNSPILDKDLLTLIMHPLGQKSATKDLREAIRSAIEKGIAYNAQVGFKLAKRAAPMPASHAGAAFTGGPGPRGGELGGAALGGTMKTGLLHLTPLKDRVGEVEAYTVLFA